MATDSVNFVDEDNTGGIFLALFEKISYTRGSNTDKHFYEL